MRQRMKPAAMNPGQGSGTASANNRMSQPLLRSQVPPRPEKRNGHLPSTLTQGHSADSGYLSSQSHRDFEVPIYENFQDLKPPSSVSASGLMKNLALQLVPEQRPRAKTPSRFETPVFVPAEIYNKPTAVQMPHSAQHFYPNSPVLESAGVVTYQELTVPLARIESGFGFRVVGGTEENSQVHCQRQPCLNADTVTVLLRYLSV